MKSEEVFWVGFRCDKWMWLENFGPNDCDVFLKGYYYNYIDFPIILSKMFRIDYKKGRINLKNMTS